MNRILLFICIIQVIFANYGFSKNDDTAEEKYLEGKTCCIKQKWNKAIIEFEELISMYPESRYVDDAYFWIGYCYEKIPERQTEAFMQFDKVVNRFPDSPWADDAVIHQIAIAEEMVSAGMEQYKPFLNEALNSQNTDIQNRAALALGRLNDKSALPVLENLTNDEELGFIAKDVIAHLGRADSSQEKSVKSGLLKKTLNILYKTEKADQVIEDDTSDFFSFLNTLRYEQYKSMLRKDNDWSKAEIHNFALWHILDTDKFQEYFVLSNEYDKKEWLRKFWKKKDPTPTTEKNEIKGEFERRFLYARAHFSAFWNYSHMKYLPDQHLRYGWEHAPWDARGELYIKYGEPDIRSIEGWHTEEWIYYSFGVDFLVKQYMTNIYGNAISGGDLSHHRYGDRFFGRRSSSWMPYLESNFIYNNELKFKYNYNAEPIEDLEMDFISHNKGLTIFYSVPVDEFIAIDKNIRYVEEIVVFNNDYREVSRKLNNRVITDLEKDINQKIEIELPIGEYSFAIKIKDNNSNKLGIYKSVVNRIK
jgi:GWxTD domain-containing protein